jgi:hypothetical protein
MIPIIANFYAPISTEGLEAGRHYWLIDVTSGRVDLDAGQAIADNALDWYQTHSLQVHAKAVATCLGGTELREG